ncbi:hypothetical protein [Thermococcus sp.]|uniref:hypothetical protein n=1 Tax=Thermococcus sp. TaxID=35749 RepID=UPI00261275B2|nr:hypothetical protein [Thermococcus sp.]
MRWKPLFAVLLGLLMVGVMAGNSYALPQKPGSPIHSPETLIKVFTGSTALVQAQAFLKKLPVTLTLNLSSLSDVTFFGVALRPTDSGVYIPAYYIVQGAKPKDYPTLQEKFLEVAKSHFKARVSNIKIASSIEPSVKWNYAGSIEYITSAVSFLDQKGMLQLKGFYYYCIINENTIEYYAKTKVRGDVSPRAALKEIHLHVSGPKDYEKIDDFLPDGHIGPVTSYSQSVMVELHSNKVAQISASAGYTTNTLFQDGRPHI